MSFFDLFRAQKREPPPERTGVELRCSFCNKTQRRARKLVAGPNANICDECVDICVDIIAAPSKEDIDTFADARPFVAATTDECSLCHMPAGEGIVIRERGILCPGCVGEIEAALATD